MCMCALQSVDVVREEQTYELLNIFMSISKTDARQNATFDSDSIIISNKQLWQRTRKGTLCWH